MTKRHFEAIAAKLYQSKPYVPTGSDAAALTSNELARRQGMYQQWHNDVVVLADIAAGFNDRFNRERFYKACGIDG